MKLSDYVAEFLAKQGVKHTFGITGGAIIHMFDSIDKTKGIKNICTQHEQAAAMAADAYSRITGNIGVAIATSGPGATNLITGVGCSYFDSIPLVIITGQVPLSQLGKNSKARQIGFQETNVVETFKPITKHAVLVEEPEKIKYELEKAFYLAKTGRPGPVLVDIPDDIQRAEIEPSELQEYSPQEDELELEREIQLENKVDQVIDLIENSERPIIILGGGIKLAKCQNKTRYLIEKLNLPVALTWAMLDSFPHDSFLSVRDFGVTANRPGNFAVQNADLIVAIGTRLDTHETGSNLSTFARQAKKIVVDIDKSELEKYQERGMPIDILINSDVKDFLDILEKKVNSIRIKDISNWMQLINRWKKDYKSCLPEYFESQEQINPYAFLDIMSDQAKQSDIIIPEAGCNVTWAMQAWKVKEGQKLFTSFNHSPMGYSLPAAIGACFANDKNPVIAIVGDGGLQMNIQELATVVKHNLPIKIFLFNNDGYGMIQQTQETWLDSRYVGTNPESGVPIPNFEKIAQAYGIKTITAYTHQDMKEKIRETLDFDGPVLFDIKIHPKARIYPKLTFGRPIEDSAPILSDQEFSENMIVTSLREDSKGKMTCEETVGVLREEEIGSTVSKKKFDIAGHKLMYHPERVAEWNEKQDFYPVYVEIGITNTCNHNCIFCALDFLENKGDSIDKEVMVNTLKEMGEKGVKSIMFAGEGEPTLHKDIGLFVQTAKQAGIDVSITTNGLLLTKEKIQEILPYLSWLRFSVDSGTPDNYSLVHGTSPEDFNKLIENIKECVRFKKENNLDVTIGVQFLVIPQNIGEAPKLAKILKEIGADNLQIKPYSHHPDSLNNLIVDPEQYNEIEQQLKEFDSDNFKIIFRKATIGRVIEGINYPECYGLPFFTLIDAKGNLIPCNLFYNKSDFYYGNLYDSSFSEIWQGEQRKQVLQKLKQKGVETCRKACRLDVINRYLHRLKNPAPHDNFV